MNRTLVRILRSSFALLVFACFCTPLQAINILIDYRYDTNNFFNSGTANGLLARAAIEEAADFFSEAITDSLDAIPYTDPNTPGGQNTPVWRQVITHPGTGLPYSISSAANASQDGLTPFEGAADEFRDIQIGANDFLIYAGATSLTGAGLGGTGVGYFGTSSFNETIDQRGKPTGEYSTWGGYVTFDNDGSSDWHYDHTLPVPSGKTDFYSVALHEIGHVLGVSSDSQEWNAHQVGSEFRGPEALAAWKAEDPSAPGNATGIPTVSSSNRHWRDNDATFPYDPNVSSYIVGTTTLQEAAMDPTITVGTRKLFTNVDTLALRDIGWTVPSSFFEVYSPADYDRDGDVDDLDYAVWESAFAVNANGDTNGDFKTDGADFLFLQREYTGPLGGTSAALLNTPEPSSLSLASLAGLLLLRRRISSN